MIAFRNIACLAKNIKLQPKLIAPFSDAWKDRDDAAEKVYITRAESKRFNYQKNKPWKSSWKK